MIVMPVIMLSPLWGLLLFYYFPLEKALPIYIVLFIIGAYFNYVMFWAMKTRHQTGLESMIGEEARAISNIDPKGKVEIKGEIWTAIAQKGRIAAGKNVRIVGTRGLTLIVKSPD